MSDETKTNPADGPEIEIPIERHNELMREYHRLFAWRDVWQRLSNRSNRSDEPQGKRSENAVFLASLQVREDRIQRRAVIANNKIGALMKQYDKERDDWRAKMKTGLKPPEAPETEAAIGETQVGGRHCCDDPPLDREEVMKDARKAFEKANNCKLPPETEAVKLIPCPNCKQPYGEIMPYEVSGCGYEDGNRCDDIPSAIIEWNSAPASPVSAGSEYARTQLLAWATGNQERLFWTPNLAKGIQDLLAPRPVDGMEERARMFVADIYTYPPYVENRVRELTEFARQESDIATQAMAGELKEARKTLEHYADKIRWEEHKESGGHRIYQGFAPNGWQKAADYLSKYPKETE